MIIDLIGVPISYGSGKDGANDGPMALREADLISLAEKTDLDIYDLGDIFVPNLKEEDKYKYHQKLKFLDPIAQINKNLAEVVYLSLKAGHFPITIGGDHSIGIGSIAGASKAYNNLDNFAVVWIDAHGDINTDDSSPSGNIHGMPLAASMNEGHEKLTNVFFNGMKVKPENVYIIGTRDVDSGEYELAEKLKLNHYEMVEVRQKGIEETIYEVIQKINDSGIKNVHLSFDIDAMDPSVTPATGTPVAGGFNMEEGEFVLSKLINTGLVKSLDFVELNPRLKNPELTIKSCLELMKVIFKSIAKISCDEFLDEFLEV